MREAATKPYVSTSQGPWDWKSNNGTEKSVIKAATCMKEHVTTSAPANPT